MDRREQAARTAERLGGLRCLVCGGALTPAPDGFRCGRGHCVNLSRRGTLNFCSRPAPAFYSGALFEARARVLAAGFFAPVLAAVERLLPAAPPEGHRLLDAGCGEGWYLASLLARHPDWTGAGVDLSRDAIRLASRQEAAALWCVADLKRLPFADGAFTAVLDILTPADYGAFLRVLAPEGVLVKVFPGPEHLRELRAARGLPPYEAGDVERYLRARTRVLAAERVCVPTPVTPSYWADLAVMTPLNAELSPEAMADLCGRSAGTVTLDVSVAVCARREDECT